MMANLFAMRSFKTVSFYKTFIYLKVLVQKYSQLQSIVKDKSRQTANVFNLTKSYAEFSQSRRKAKWTNDYKRGTGMEMYTETLSPSFVGILFKHAAE